MFKGKAEKGCFPEKFGFRVRKYHGMLNTRGHFTFFRARLAKFPCIVEFR